MALHAEREKHLDALADKRGQAPDVARPELFPSLREKYSSTLNYEGNVVQSCIHCHQIGDAQRTLYRSRNEPFPDTILFPMPHPSTIGLTLDPQKAATLLAVEPESPAAAAGLQAGDSLTSLNGQPLISIADVQWVLHQTPDTGGEIQATVERAAKSESVTLPLPPGWKRAGDLSWRVSTWGLRRMAAGGMVLVDCSDEERKASHRPSGQLLLKVKNVGQYGPHAVARNAGVKPGDLLIEYDGRTDLLRETDVLVYGVNQRQPGEMVPVKVLREGKPITVSLLMQE